jgi:hypothetical protein
VTSIRLLVSILGICILMAAMVMMCLTLQKQRTGLDREPCPILAFGP